MILGEGLKPDSGHDEKRKAEEILEKVVARACGNIAVLQKKSRRPPGPSPSDSTNSTSKTRDRLKGNIRATLDVSRKEWPDPKLFSLLLNIFRSYDRLCSRGIFFDGAEKSTIDWVLENIRSDRTAEICKDLLAEIAYLESRFIRSDRFGWDSFLNCAIIYLPSEIGAFNKPNDEYAALGQQLGLLPQADGQGSLEEITKEVESLEESIKGRSQKTNRFKKRKNRLNELRSVLLIRSKYSDEVPSTHILKMAVAQLERIRTVLRDSWYIETTMELEWLYERLWEINLYPWDSLAMSPIADLASAFLTALQRQGRSPFPPLPPEEIEFGPPKFPGDSSL